MKARGLKRLGACALFVVLLGGAEESGGCGGGDRLTRDEAKMALEEAALAAKASALTSGSVEIATEFTIGDAVESAADEIRAFIESQMPCAEVTLSGNTLAVEYGALAGDCTYRGQTWSGTHSITVMANEMTQVIVQHEWTDFQNEEVMVNGSAEVTWDFEAATRRVVHESTWTDLETGREATGNGDRTQQALEGGVLEGIRVDGERSWMGESGDWLLTIDGVEMRWIDPVPQTGSYTLETPFDKTITLSFDRVDTTTIEVTVTGPENDFDFDVATRAGG